MIKVIVYRNPKGNFCGFDADDHGESFVCAAVSILTLNAVNSIEQFTDENFSCDYHEDVGYLSFVLPDVRSGMFNHDVDLLLKSMVLGLEDIQTEYHDELQVIYKEVL